MTAGIVRHVFLTEEAAALIFLIFIKLKFLASPVLHFCLSFLIFFLAFGNPGQSGWGDMLLVKNIKNKESQFNEREIKQARMVLLLKCFRPSY